MEKSEAIRLGTKPHIKAGRGKPGREKGPMSRQESEETPLPLLGVPEEPQTNTHSIYAKDWAQTYALWVMNSSISVRPNEPYIVNTVDHVLLVTSVHLFP